MSYKQQPQKAGVAILISDKTDFKTKKVTREIDGHFKLCSIKHNYV